MAALSAIPHLAEANCEQAADIALSLTSSLIYLDIPGEDVDAMIVDALTALLVQKPKVDLANRL